MGQLTNDSFVCPWVIDVVVPGADIAFLHLVLDVVHLPFDLVDGIVLLRGGVVTLGLSILDTLVPDAVVVNLRVLQFLLKHLVDSLLLSDGAQGYLGVHRVVVFLLVCEHYSKIINSKNIK